MLILALNCGSSSVKTQLYDWNSKAIVAKAIVERIGLDNPTLTVESRGNKVKNIEEGIVDHKSAIEYIIDAFVAKEGGVVSSIKEIVAVGHRVVHGGDIFKRSVLVSRDVIDSIISISFLAPLHNPANVEGIEEAMKLMPDIPHIAIFDTAFHQSIPEEIFRYALPSKWFEKYKVRRYGFHGTSNLYVSKRAAYMLSKHANLCNMIVLHIGNGVSVTAIKNGRSMDTSMGMTPLEGAIMGTRCGDIDPAISTFMQKQAGLSPKDVEDALNRKSGLLGITEKYSDRRDIENNMGSDRLCQLAIDMECYRLKKYIGMYIAALANVDAIVFTAGVGENSPIIRGKTLENLEFLGIDIDKEKNKNTFSKNGETVISKESSKIKVFVIPTDEEIVFIEDAVAVLNGNEADHMEYPYSFI